MNSTKPKPFGFILMPFEKSFDDIYAYGIKAGCEEIGSYCERVDEQIFQETILERIFNQIAKADFIIADMTGKNPNVFYEVGYAHALGKRTVLLTQQIEDIPFDLKHFPHIIYENSIKKLKDQLIPRIKWFNENPLKSDDSYKIGIELYYNEFNLSSETAIYKLNENEIVNPKITIQNKSFITYEPGDFQIGIIVNKHFPRCRNKNITTINMPDGGYLHMLPFFDKLFPQSFTSFHLLLETIQSDHIDDLLVFRIFTKSGFRDYLLTINR